MISWIKGVIITSWLQNHKSYLLVSCQGIGYEIQVLECIKTNSIEKEIILWIEHIKREDSDYLFGFIHKEERDFFRDLLKVRGIGPQIGMSLLNNYSINEVKNSLINQNKDLISSVPGIGKKMTERIFLELKNKIKVKEETEDTKRSIYQNGKEEIKFIFKDIDIALRSLEYPIKDIKNTINILMNDFNDEKLTISSEDDMNFENLLKKAIYILENNNSKFG